LSGPKLAPELLALDLDGTLVDSAPDIAHCLGRALEAVGFEAPGEARTRVWIGDGLENTIARALAHSAHTEPRAPGEGLRPDERQAAALRAFLDCYHDNLFVRSRLYPGVAETLDALRARGLTLCCITNKRFAFSDALLRQAGVREHFALVLGGDSLPEKKPSPLPLLAAAEQLGVPASAAVLVGDSHQDLRAARGAGYGFVLATYGYGKVDETEAAAVPRIRGFADVLELLDAT
jgi:phosphoglycolate phosphatase